MAYPNQLYIPIIQQKYQLQGLFDQKKWASLVAAGVLTAEAIEDTWEPEAMGKAWKPGDLIYLPAQVQAAPFAPVDLSNTGAGTFNQVSANLGSVPIIRAASFNQMKRYDVLRTGEDLRAKLDASIPNLAARFFLTILGDVLKAAMTATTTFTYPAVVASTGPAYSPDAGQIFSHVYNIATGNPSTGAGLMTVNTLNAMRSLMGDVGLDSLHTLVAPMAVILDLYYDLVNNYKYNSPMAQFLIDGSLMPLIGVKNLIPSDLLPFTAGQFNSSGIDTYSSFLLGDDFVHYFYAREMDVEFFENVPQAITTLLVKYNLDFSVFPRFFQYTGPTGSPQLSDLTTAGNYGVQTEDHRNIKCVELLSYGFGGRRPATP